jgi:hypothetical protein
MTAPQSLDVGFAARFRLQRLLFASLGAEIGCIRTAVSYRIACVLPGAEHSGEGTGAGCSSGISGVMA